jgi:ABC-2 type transport system permease protein
MSARTWKVFSYELLRNLRRKAFLFTTFGLPIISFVALMLIQQLALGSLFEEDDNSIPGLNGIDLSGANHAGFVDESGLLTEDSYYNNMLTRYPDEASARAGMEADEVDLYFLIPANYLETGEVESVMPRLSIGLLNQDLIERLLTDTLIAPLDEPLKDRLRAPADYETVNLGQIQEDGSIQSMGSSMFLVYAFAAILLLSLFMTNGYLMQSMIEERETRLIDILAATLKPLELLMGKILALGVLGLFQLGVWAGAMLLLSRWNSAGATAGQMLSMLNFSIPGQFIPLLVIYFILAYLMFASLYTMVGSISNSMREGPQYATAFILPAVSPLWFTQLFVTDPNGPIPLVLSLVPITSPLSMIQRLVLGDVPAWQVGLSIALLVVTDIVLIWLASRVFRVQTLLAGQPMRMRDLPNLMRG